MPIAVLVMVVLLALALAVVALVAIGMQGAGKRRMPELANAMAETARHLNGDAEPPQRLVEFFGEIDDIRRSATTASSSTSPA